MDLLCYSKMVSVYSNSLLKFHPLKSKKGYTYNSKNASVLLKLGVFFNPIFVKKF